MKNLLIMNLFILAHMIAQGQYQMQLMVSKYHSEKYYSLHSNEILLQRLKYHNSQDMFQNIAHIIMVRLVLMVQLLIWLKTLLVQIILIYYYQMVNLVVAFKGVLIVPQKDISLHY